MFNYLICNTHKLKKSGNKLNTWTYLLKLVSEFIVFGWPAHEARHHNTATKMNVMTDRIFGARKHDVFLVWSQSNDCLSGRATRKEKTLWPRRKSGSNRQQQLPLAMGYSLDQ